MAPSTNIAGVRGPDAKHDLAHGGARFGYGDQGLGAELVARARSTLGNALDLAPMLPNVAFDLGNLVILRGFSTCVALIDVEYVPPAAPGATSETT